MDSHGNVNRLWDGDTSSSERPLRRPHAAIAAGSNPQLGGPSQPDQQPNVQDSQLRSPLSAHTITNNMVNMTITSSLSAEAKEWYPPNFGQQQRSLSSVQNRLNRFKPQDQFTDNNMDDDSIENQDTNYLCDAAIAVTRLQEIMNTITYDPGQFDGLLETFIDILSPYFEDLNTANHITDIIFAQANREASFRYNGARLCSIIQDKCPFFRSRLHILCEKELQHHRDLQGFTLFLAELYTQLHSENLYGKSLIESMKKLIAKGDADNIKCVCQALKLSGYSLETSDKKAIDEIFCLMLDKHSNLPSNVKNLMKYVEELRGKEWGHVSPQPTSSNGHQEENGFNPKSSSNDYVYFNEDGQEFFEEREILANCEEYNNFLCGNYDPDDLCDPEPEMDEEIQAAFKEFVQLSKR